MRCVTGSKSIYLFSDFEIIGMLRAMKNFVVAMLT